MNLQSYSWAILVHFFLKMPAYRAHASFFSSQDPPDETKCNFRQEDLMNAGCMGSERDEELRQYLLFQDKPVAIQQGLVIFVNNAEEVFASRANDTGSGVSLDEHIAELFGNMAVGGRMVTLT